MPIFNNHKSTIGSLPRDGWLHECLVCELITSKIIIYRNNIVYICNLCQKKYLDNLEKYILSYKKYHKRSVKKIK
jgi:hypothetical protein